MPRKISKKTLIKKLDKAWSEAIKKQAGYKCEVCGKKEGLNAHHYISRINRMLRWETYNGICVCTKHHLFGNESFHKNPEWGHFWMEENRWEDLQKINCNMNQIKKWSLDDMQEKLEELNNL